MQLYQWLQSFGVSMPQVSSLVAAPPLMVIVCAPVALSPVAELARVRSLLSHTTVSSPEKKTLINEWFLVSKKVLQNDLFVPVLAGGHFHLVFRPPPPRSNLEPSKAFPLEKSAQWFVPVNLWHIKTIKRGLP